MKWWTDWWWYLLLVIQSNHSTNQQMLWYFMTNQSIKYSLLIFYGLSVNQWTYRSCDILLLINQSIAGKRFPLILSLVNQSTNGSVSVFAYEWITQSVFQQRLKCFFPCILRRRILGPRRRMRRRVMPRVAMIKSPPRKRKRPKRRRNRRSTRSIEKRRNPNERYVRCVSSKKWTRLAFMGVHKPKSYCIGLGISDKNKLR